MHEIVWTMEHQSIGRIEVRGFSSGKRARKHALKHFLNPAEGWQQLRPETGPAAYRRALEESGLSRETMLCNGWNDQNGTRILNEAVTTYVDAVRRQTSGPGILDGGSILSGVSRNCRVKALRINVVTETGVFAVFRDGHRPSDLLTAYRPTPGVRRGPLTMAQFQRAALNKLSRQKAKSRQRP